MLNIQRYVCLCRSQNGYRRVKMATVELKEALLEQRRELRQVQGLARRLTNPAGKSLRHY